MPSEKERFFSLHSFAVVGNSDLKPFPRLTYLNLRATQGKRVFPVELGSPSTVEGDRAYESLAALPEEVEGVIVELPRDQVMPVVQQAAEAGIKEVWLHMKSDSPEVLWFCREHGINVRWGSCAVMYTQQKFSFHSIHKLIEKLLRRY